MVLEDSPGTKVRVELLGAFDEVCCCLEARCHLERRLFDDALLLVMHTGDGIDERVLVNDRYLNRQLRSDDLQVFIAVFGP